MPDARSAPSRLTGIAVDVSAARVGQELLDEVPQAQRYLFTQTTPDVDVWPQGRRRRCRGSPVGSATPAISSSTRQS